MRRNSASIIVALTLLVTSACALRDEGAASDTSGGSASPAVTANLAVSHPTVWVCRPGMINDNCASNLDATTVGPTGPTGTEPFEAAKDPGVDCFYVYPTVSRVGLANAPLKVTDTAISIVRAQAARFAANCRVFAPAYQQYTVVSRLQDGGVSEASRDIAFVDVQSAWNDYLLNDNKGRGVVLIGDDQGAEMLLRLLRTEIEPDAVQRTLLVSALLVGADVRVRPGSLTGGDLASLSACQRHDEYGCVVAYSAYLGKAPKDAFFGVPSAPVRGSAGKDGSDTLQVLCTNPAALGGGAGVLAPYLPTTAVLANALVDDGVLPGLTAANMPAAATGFVSYPNLLAAACEKSGQRAWLSISLRPSALGDVRALPASDTPASWGLHFLEFDLTLGDLVELAGRQASAYLADHPVLRPGG